MKYFMTSGNRSGGTAFSERRDNFREPREVIITSGRGLRLLSKVPANVCTRDGARKVLSRKFYGRPREFRARVQVEMLKRKKRRRKKKCFYYYLRGRVKMIYLHD